MESTIERRLERLKNRHSRYELVATNGQSRFLVAYCCRNTRRGLVDACYQRAQHLIRLTGADTFERAGSAAEGIILGNWHIRFSGRTQREAILSGELDYVGNCDMVRVQ